MNNVKINNLIDEWLLYKEHTKQDLASQLDMSVQTLNNRLDGKFGWSWDEAVTLADFFEVSVAELR